MPYYMATIQILIEVDSQDRAYDAIVDGLRPVLKEYADNRDATAIVDWRYADEDCPLPEEHNGHGFDLAEREMERRASVKHVALVRNPALDSESAASVADRIAAMRADAKHAAQMMDGAESEDEANALARDLSQ